MRNRNKCRSDKWINDAKGTGSKQENCALCAGQKERQLVWGSVHGLLKFGRLHSHIKPV